MSLVEYSDYAIGKPRRIRASASQPRRGRKQCVPGPRPPASETAPHLVDAGRLARHFIGQLDAGEHTFASLRAEFSAWCEEGGIDAVSDAALGRWLREAGLKRRRAGRRKVTVYANPAARFAA